MGLMNVAIGEENGLIEENDGFLVYADRKLRRDVFYIVCPYGLGDTLYVASFVKALREIRLTDFTRICLIVKERHDQIPDWFDSIDQKIVSNKMVNLLNGFSIGTGIWELKNYLYGHFPKICLMNALSKDAEWTLCPEYKSCEPKDMVSRYKKLVFHLPADCKMEEPKIIPRQEVLELVTQNYEIGQRTVILMPHASSMQPLPLELWETIVQLLTKLGYIVYTNVNGTGEVPIKGTEALCTDVATMAALCEQCRLVIALRSGLCDILAFTETRLIILNSDEIMGAEWDLKAVIRKDGINNYWMSDGDLASLILSELY